MGLPSCEREAQRRRSGPAVASGGGAVDADEGPDKPLAGEVALVTGGSRGIGLAIVRELLVVTR